MAAAIEGDARAEVVRTNQLGLLPVDHAHVAQRVAIECRHRRGGAGAFVGTGLRHS
jgi:hypothetical protein